MTLVHALTGRSRFQIVPHICGGVNVVDSAKALPISRNLAGRHNAFEAWQFIKGLAA